MLMRLASPFSGLETIVAENVPLAPHTWYKIGGPARWFVRPRNLEELRETAGRCAESNIPVYVLGLGANLLVGDDGVYGAVFRLDEDHWRKVSFNGTAVEAGSGADIQKLVLKTARQGLTGLECLAGIPGTVGGAVRMNAGGKFGDIGARVNRVQVMDLAGNVFERLKDDLVFDYRSTNISAPFILGATFHLDEDDPDRLAKRLKEIWMFKRNSQPLNTKNAGCIFKNPRGSPPGRSSTRQGSRACASAAPKSAPSTPTSSSPIRAAGLTTCSSSSRSSAKKCTRRTASTWRAK